MLRYISCTYKNTRTLSIIGCVCRVCCHRRVCTEEEEWVLYVPPFSALTLNNPHSTIQIHLNEQNYLQQSYSWYVNLSDIPPKHQQWNWYVQKCITGGEFAVYILCIVYIHTYVALQYLSFFCCCFFMSPTWGLGLNFVCSTTKICNLTTEAFTK